MEECTKYAVALLYFCGFCESVEPSTPFPYLLQNNFSFHYIFSLTVKTQLVHTFVPQYQVSEAVTTLKFCFFPCPCPLEFRFHFGVRGKNLLMRTGEWFLLVQCFSAFDNCFLQCLENILCFCHLKYDQKFFLFVDVKFMVESYLKS